MRVPPDAVPSPRPFAASPANEPRYVLASSSHLGVNAVVGTKHTGAPNTGARARSVGVYAAAWSRGRCGRSCRLALFSLVGWSALPWLTMAP